MPSAPKSTPLLRYHRALSKHYGPLGWWPGETPLEVMVGAVLVQNTAWTNVEKAIANLKRERLLSLKKLHQISHDELAALIQPAGYFNLKSKRLKSLVGAVMDDWRGDLSRMFAAPTGELRAWLLGVHGVGKETADSILCYAAGHPVFVVDAYTRRILSRHALVDEEIGYDHLQDFCTGQLPQDLATYNEFHAQIVHVGKDYCRSKPRCEGCPLSPFFQTPPAR
ncbi:MAG: endonuclease III domain-containing protein [Chrysiogenetes bacterium]|nr:endonuclease III domain-containing protein [Chrysiogenetes bacterium]